MLKNTFVICALTLFSVSAFADEPKVEGPCKTVMDACQSAGFVKNEAKDGKGLWVDCIDPIMQGTAQPAKATIKLPTVDAGTVAACKAKHPKFGVGGGKKK
jgi:hypothetical protein